MFLIMVVMVKALIGEAISETMTVVELNEKITFFHCLFVSIAYNRMMKKIYVRNKKYMVSLLHLN
jgi:hypothetical protein